MSVSSMLSLFYLIGLSVAGIDEEEGIAAVPGIDWKYDIVSEGTDGRPCMNNCKNGICTADFNGTTMNCRSTNVPSPTYYLSWHSANNADGACLSNCEYFGERLPFCVCFHGFHQFCNPGVNNVTIYGNECSGECIYDGFGYYRCDVSDKYNNNTRKNWQLCALPRKENNVKKLLQMKEETTEKETEQTIQNMPVTTNTQSETDVTEM